jgi:hypothetical protein
MAKLVSSVRIVFGCLAAGSVAGAVALAGCGGDDNSGTPDASSSSSSSSSGGTSSSSSSSGGSSSSSGGSSSSSSSSGGSSSSSGGSSSSSSSSGGGDAGVDATLGSDAGGGGDADAGALACNTAATLLANGGTLLFSFDDGGLSGFTTNPPVDPADAGLTITAVGNATVGNTCPGSIQVTVPFSTVGQKVQVLNALNFPGIPVTGTVLHLALRVLATANADGGADGGADPYQILSGPGATGNYQPYYQAEYATLDGDVPRDDSGAALGYGTQNFNVNNPWATLPEDGGWQMVNVPLLSADGGATTSLYLDQVGVIMYTPPITDAGAAPLPSPVTVQVFIDDIWVE